MSVKGQMSMPVGVRMYDPRRFRRRVRTAAIMETNRRLAHDLANAERSKHALAGLIDQANRRAAQATSFWGRLKALLTVKVW